jgi:hypothetical protein
MQAFISEIQLQWGYISFVLFPAKQILIISMKWIPSEDKIYPAG